MGGKINPGMKMMLMNRAGDREYRSEYTGNGNDRRMIGYDRPENARHGGYRSEYDNNDMRRYAAYDNYPESRYLPMGGWHEPPMDRYPMDNYPEHDRPESRRRRSRRTGRFIKGGGYDDDDDDETEGKGPQMHYDGMTPGNSYGDIYARGTIYAPNAMNRPNSSEGQKQYGRVTEKKARKWVEKMTDGEKMPVEQTEQLRKTQCPDCEKWEFYVALNAMYNDYCDTAKKFGMDKPEFYAALAKDFLEDEDADEYKLQKYMEYIPKK